MRTDLISSEKYRKNTNFQVVFYLKVTWCPAVFQFVYMLITMENSFEYNVTLSKKNG